MPPDPPRVVFVITLPEKTTLEKVTNFGAPSQKNFLNISLDMKQF